MTGGGAEVVIIGRKCTISVICLNHVKTTFPPLFPWKNCLPKIWSLMPKRLGTAELQESNCLMILRLLRIFCTEISNYYSLLIQAFDLMTLWYPLCLANRTTSWIVPSAWPRQPRAKKVMQNKAPSYKGHSNKTLQSPMVLWNKNVNHGPSNLPQCPFRQVLSKDDTQDKWKWTKNKDKVNLFPCGSVDKESACNVGDLGSIPGLGRSGEGNGNLLQYSCQENPIDGGAW